MKRARCVRALGLLALPASGVHDARAQPVNHPPVATPHTRPIPATGEALPVIGCGRWRGFDQAPASAGRGELLAGGNRRAHAFVASKVWTRGRAEGVGRMTQSMRLLRTGRIDLMPVHNLVDWKTQLPALREWKAAGRGSVTSASRTAARRRTPRSRQC